MKSLINNIKKIGLFFIATRLSKYAGEIPAVEEDRESAFKGLIFLAVLFISMTATCSVKAADSITKQRFHFSIPQQPAVHSLSYVAEQANITLIFPFEAMASKTANAIEGEYSVENALGQLLQGTGYAVSVRSNGHINIVLAKKSLGGIEVMHKLNKVASAVMMMVAASSVAMPASAQEAQSSDQFEEIVVTGIRGSLQRAADIKRGSDVVVDAISAEELGKFPDINVAESLSRITGVAVTRTRGGEGQFVTVRGLGEEFNGVTYNGRLLATENEGREFSFDVIASELIAGAQVYKTTTAKQGDGSLGGLVNINSAKPLDNPGFHASGSIATQYEELADDFGPRFSGVISNTFNDDTMGILASISYQKRNARTDVAESNFLIFPVQVDSNGEAAQNLDQNGDGLTDNTGAQILTNDGRFNGFSAFLAEQERERIGGTLAFQYQPNDNFGLTLDALYTKFETPSDINGYSFFPTAFGQGFVTNAQLNDSNQVVSFDSNAFAYDALSRRNEGDNDTIAFGANADWILSDRSRLVLDASFSKSEGQRDNLGSATGSGAFFVIGTAGGTVSQRLTGREVPDFQFNVVNPTTGATVQPGQLNPEDYRLHFGRNDIVLVEDEVQSLKADYEFDFSDTSKLSVGADYVAREKVTRAFTNTDLACTLCTNYTIPLSTNGASIAGLVTGQAPSDFLSGISANIPRNFDTLNLDVVQASFIANAPAGTYTPTINEAGSTNIDEQVFGVYAQYDFAGEAFGLPYQANIGARLSKTDLTSTGFGNQLTDIQAIDLLADGNNQNFAIGAPRPVSIDNDYTNFLPSFNISFDLNESTILRAGVSSSVSRPTLTSLSTSFIVTSQNRGGEAITSNNPELEAIESNNFDLSLEWYGENGTSASAALFYKDISNFVTQRVTTEPVNVAFRTQAANGIFSPAVNTPINFRIQRPENGDDAEILGLEVGGQYFTESGWGVSANVTLADSEATSAGIESDLENISDFAANLSVFYENDRWSGRVSVNNRSEYLVGQTAEGGRDEFVDDFTQVDLSFSYVFNDFLTFYAEGINVLDEPFFRYSETRDLLESYEENGARYVFGLRGNF